MVETDVKKLLAVQYRQGRLMRIAIGVLKLNVILMQKVRDVEKTLQLKKQQQKIEEAKDDATEIAVSLRPQRRVKESKEAAVALKKKAADLRKAEGVKSVKPKESVA